MVLEATLSNSVIPKGVKWSPTEWDSPSLTVNLLEMYLAVFNCLTTSLKIFPPAVVNLGDFTDPLFFFPNIAFKVWIPKVLVLLM